jgi:3-deoxy-D-manno-octulosonate 8-phosphate phosphatase (KDO 8-P phosphatase)
MSAHTIRLMAFDVDGIFTDGTLYYGIEGDTLKAFNILDGLGLKLLQKAGIQTAIITGRQSPMVEKRFSELGVDFVIQGREDKGQALENLANKLALEKKDIGYIGDDFPDLSTLHITDFFATVPNAPLQVQEIASFVTVKSGGQGAVRELCEFLLEAQGFDPLALYRGDSV